MKTVVSNISYESLWGHDGTWAKNHTTTQVPDETDLSYKADKTDLAQIKNQLQSQLNDENRKRTDVEDKLIQVVERQEQFVDKTTLNQLKSDLVGAERLNKEKDFVTSIGDEIIDRIRKQCEIERKAIHNEVVAFREIDINKDLQQRLEPMSVTLNQLVVLAKSIQSQLDELGQTKEEILSVYKRIVQTHGEIIAAKEEIDNRLKIVQNCEEHVDAILKKVQENGQQVQQNRQLCEIACESIEETKNNIVQQVKQMEECEAQLKLSHDDSLRQMQTLTDDLKNVGVQIRKEKNAFDISCKDASDILSNAKELLRENHNNNLLVQSDIEKSMSDIKDKIAHLNGKTKECDNLCDEIVGTAKHLQPQMENARKIKDEMIDLHHQSTSTINTMISDIRTLLNNQKDNYNKMQQQQKEQYDKFIERLQIKTNETAREAAVSEIRSMSFSEKVKWMFSGKK